ncbi:MAG TPA: 4Fe-4S dicluster domain-containing protein [Bacteroidales bacterium]|nr:4Fe-4S dicluster domain-containing protein [Bacteroidales bacterium]
MNNLVNRAKELLESGKVQIVIGYEAGPTGIARPAFITDPLKAGILMYDERCTMNLAVYLTKEEVKSSGKMAIVATLPVMRSIMVLISEHQVTADNIVVLGISADGSLLEIADPGVMQSVIEKSDLSLPANEKEKLNELLKLSPAERFDWWQKELSKCIKCYACRQACPMCYCTRCAVEVNQPQWIPVKADIHGNMEWHILRAMHLAGRCIECGECGRACPVGIPCHLLTMHLSEQVYGYFKVSAGTSEKMASVLSTYDPNDKESFII